MRKILLSGAVLAFLASPSLAADVVTYEQIEQPIALQWYVNLHGGVKFGEDWDDRATNTFDLGGNFFLDLGLDGEASTEDGTIFGVAVGREFNEFFRAEVEVNWLHQDWDSLDIDSIDGAVRFGDTVLADFDVDCNAPACSGIGLDGDVDTLMGMVNALVGFPINEGTIRPYFGIGVGIARVDIDAGISDGGVGLCCLDDSDTVFALQAILGVDLQVTQNIALGIRGRAIHLGDVELEDDAGFHHELEPDMMNTAEAVITLGF